jgi:HEAT repeat protein
LIRSFSDRNADVHRNIVHAFEKLGDQVHEALLKCIEGEDVELKKNSAIAFAEMHDERGVDHIVMLMEDSDPKVRAAAAEALGFFPCIKSKTILTEGLHDKAIEVRLKVIRSLGKMQSRPEILALLDHMSKSRDDRETRTVKRTLGELAGENPDLFIDLFTHEHNSFRTYALEALAEAGMDSMARLTQVAAESDDETIVFWCKKAIKKIKEPRENFFYG